MGVCTGFGGLSFLPNRTSATTTCSAPVTATPALTINSCDKPGLCSDFHDGTQTGLLAVRLVRHTLVCSHLNLQMRKQVQKAKLACLELTQPRFNLGLEPRYEPGPPSSCLADQMCPETAFWSPAGISVFDSHLPTFPPSLVLPGRWKPVILGFSSPTPGTADSQGRVKALGQLLNAFTLWAFKALQSAGT